MLKVRLRIITSKHLSRLLCNEGRGIETKGAALIIGSLFWDDGPGFLRKSWRERLNFDEKIHVKAPIRYGRYSTNRDTYTMVFSNLISIDNYGMVWAIPFKKDASSIDDILMEAKEMGKAEGFRGGGGLFATKGWGFMGLLTNTDMNMKSIEDKWMSRIGSEFMACRSILFADGEEPYIDEKGIYRIEWPRACNGRKMSGIDFLLATATAPTLENGHYPNKERIAEKMATPRQSEYFERNRENGITTYMDEELKRLYLERRVR